MILIKNLSDSADWEVYHSATGNTGNLVLNDTAAFASNSGFMANTSPTATVFTVGNDGYVNGAGDGHIAYCFHDVTGYSKFGSYEGNQTLNTDNVVNFGFAPDFVMIKNADEGGSQWIVIDSVRTNGYAFYANTSATESNYSTDILISSQGLRFVSNNINVNKASRTYIYAAFKIN